VIQNEKFILGTKKWIGLIPCGGVEKGVKFILPEEGKVLLVEVGLEWISWEFNSVLIWLKDGESVFKDIFGELCIDKGEFFVEDFKEEIFYEWGCADFKCTVLLEQLW
jgi:hypothetical protein